MFIKLPTSVLLRMRGGAEEGEGSLAAGWSLALCTLSPGQVELAGLPCSRSRCVFEDLGKGK